MKRAAVSMVLVVLALGSFIAADEKRAEVLFQAAMAKETVEGNLQGARAGNLAPECAMVTDRLIG